jgi:hypothetical protein
LRAVESEDVLEHEYGRDGDFERPQQVPEPIRERVRLDHEQTDEQQIQQEQGDVDGFPEVRPVIEQIKPDRLPEVSLARHGLVAVHTSRSGGPVTKVPVYRDSRCSTSFR